MKRLCDIVASFIGLLILLPLFLFLGIWISMESRGGVFYKQIRVGRNGVDFKLWKFRSMVPDADKKGLLTVGGRDPRITRAGYFLRKYKLDELPQLINVLLGDMSLVGPRPEVRKYVDLYSDEQRKVLSVRPGITDHASLEYFEENELLAKSDNPEETYIKEVMPAKLKLNARYINESGLITDLKIIARTILRIIR
ncbi:MAG: sugar transferase [Bacteroidetes bacterium]|jgi:lipopolysaccharide/colanic/teichoic acid biosynthesis glycosyltransferase|nr:sugar transferase [Bacteroidota bacterium]